MEVYNASGQRVAQLFSGDLESGVQQQLYFNTERLPSGAYFCRLISGEAILTEQLVVMH